MIYYHLVKSYKIQNEVYNRIKEQSDKNQTARKLRLNIHGNDIMKREKNIRKKDSFKFYPTLLLLSLLLLLLLLRMKYRHIFIKSCISNKTFPIYSTIHFRHRQKFNDKTK